jgi:hypothetical protein
MKCKGFVFLAAFAALALGMNASATTVLSVSANTPVTFALGGPSYEQILAQQFIASSALKNVSVSAQVGNNGQALSTINAWLTTAIGPNETTANVIASATIAPSSSDSMQTLFSGLTLTPGTYYLVLSGGSTTDTEADWWGTNGSTAVTSADGVSYNGGDYYYYANVSQLDDAPAVNFNYLPNSLNLNSNVTGDLVSPASAPEPASEALLILGAAVGLLFAKHRRTA